MKITIKELRNVIKEASTRPLTLGELKTVNKKAYDGWVEMLIEDYPGEFLVNPDGSVEVFDPQTKKSFRFKSDPRSASMDVGGGWDEYKSPGVKMRSRR